MDMNKSINVSQLYKTAGSRHGPVQDTCLEGKRNVTKIIGAVSHVAVQDSKREHVKYASGFLRGETKHSFDPFRNIHDTSLQNHYQFSADFIWALRRSTKETCPAISQGLQLTTVRIPGENPC
jgi:hypothetical protein